MTETLTVISERADDIPVLLAHPRREAVERLTIWRVLIRFPVDVGPVKS